MSRTDDLDAPFPPAQPPLPSTTELERLLPMMDDAQKAELLALLEARDRLQAARPVDSTPSVKDLLDKAWQETAATRANPEEWLAAMRAHSKRRDFHLARIAARKPPPRTLRELLMASSPKDWAEAKRLAIADGFPDPATIPDEPKVEDEVAAALKGGTKRSE